MKQNYKILTVLFIALSFTLSFGQSGGTGTSGDPYQISNYADLVWLQGASGEWGAGKYFLQTIDIDAAATSGDGWNPIGNQAFGGTYDGGGFAIDNLNITGAGELGFIEECIGGTVKDLGLTNVVITKNGGNYASALIAYMNGGTIENCYSTGTITSSVASEFNGGLIGRVVAGNVSDSYSEVSLSGMLPFDIGGFIGLINSSATITNCYATGNVEGNYDVGGCIGKSEGGSISKCYGTGNVTADDTGIGGFIGYNYQGTVSECYSRGDVTGGGRVGGFVGYNRHSTGVISNCYSLGSVLNGDSHSGGFCGRAYDESTIEYCYSTGTCFNSDKGFIGAPYNSIFTDDLFDTETSGCTDGSATGKTTAEMKTTSTFTNWDFASTWEIDGGDGANYPRLQNQPDPALPVELTSFTATPSGNVVVLNWETATEVNNYGFEVEASSDNSNWSKIGFVSGHGNSNSPNSYSFTDVTVAERSRSYRLKQVDTDGAFEYSEIVEVEGNLSYKLNQNHPNPFNPTTVISFSIPEASKVSITIFNALGQEVAKLANREFAVGNHSIDFNASNLSSGIYFYTLNSANFTKTMKMLLLK